MRPGQFGAPPLSISPPHPSTFPTRRKEQEKQRTEPPTPNTEKVFQDGVAFRPYGAPRASTPRGRHSARGQFGAGSFGCEKPYDFGHLLKRQSVCSNSCRRATETMDVFLTARPGRAPHEASFRPVGNSVLGLPSVRNHMIWGISQNNKAFALSLFEFLPPR